jgi:alkylation response protein AidB-like acyl-CoA dehydrogenase
MTQFKVDTRDVEFAIFDNIYFERLAELPRYRDYTRELLEMVLGQARKLAADELAPCNHEADREGVRLEDGQVYVPEAYEEIYQAFCEGGWMAPSRPVESGGQGLPSIVSLAATEFFIAANPSFSFFPGLTSAAGALIEERGSEEQRDLYVEKLYTGEWTGTMCLTEPQAGSSVGDLTTSAEPVDGEDYYRITGNKIFISQGDHQLTENIVHLVLARVPGDPEGTKGISLFIVPKIRPSDGQFNDVRATGVEEKMGIHASPTCAMSFGDDGDCRGWLVGDRCEGMVHMFKMMNEARIATGLQGVALGNAAYQLALDYAKERTQGSKVTDRRKDAPTVAIIEHPDVRRNLMIMKAYGEATRALLYNAAALADLAHHSEDDTARQEAQDLLDLLTPICKAFATDVGFEMTELAMQVFGGYGYISEYGVEQCMRDVKIASIYEGTNGIQALDLLGRKMRLNNGALFLTWLQNTNEFLQSLSDDETFGDLAQEVDNAKNALAEAAFGFSQMGKEDPEYPLLHATPFLRMFGLVESARLLLRQAVTAHGQLTDIWDDKGVDADDDEARDKLAGQNDQVRFLESKLQTARFFVHQLLPQVGAHLASIQSGDTSALEAYL